MKRKGILLSLIMILVIMGTSVAFAAGSLTLEKSYPKDGGKNAAIENFGVKLYFNGEFTEKALKGMNNDAIKLYGPKNEALPVRVLYPQKEKGVVLALLDTSKKGDNGSAVRALGNSDYKIVISPDFVDNKGRTMGKETTIAFSTLNQTANTMIYMGMTLLMFIGIGVVTMRGNKKAAEEDSESKKDDRVNPYKEAKKTGKSVEEVLEKERREKEKRAAKEAKKAAKEEELLEEYAELLKEELPINHYKVKGIRTIASAGSKYITGRKALAEEKALEEQRRREQEAKWAASKKKKKK